MILMIKLQTSPPYAQGILYGPQDIRKQSLTWGAACIDWCATDGESTAGEWGGEAIWLITALWEESQARL